MKIQLPVKNGESPVVNADKIVIELYGQIIWLVVGQEDQMKKVDERLEEGAMLENEGTGEFIIWLREKNLSVLVHEIYHIVEILTKHLMLGRVGSAEAQAYLAEYIFIKALKIKTTEWLIK